jgi:hypothetical protein
MPNALTVGSTIQCAHQGKVVLVASQQSLTVDGQAVLVDGDLANAAISGCATVPAPGPPPTTRCLMISSVIGGKSTTLSVGGKAVLLDSISGITNGVLAGTPQTWSVTSAGQTKLTGR